MPRPPRSRVNRQAAAPQPDTLSKATSSSDDMYKVTPQKPKDARPDSAEKENGPKRTSGRVAARLGSSGSKKNILGDASSRARVTTSCRSRSNAVEAQEEKQTGNLLKRGRRPTRSSGRRDTSGLDLHLSDDEALDLDTTLDDMPNDNTGSIRGRSRSASATRSANTSAFSISQFKRRSRAPSIIGRPGGEESSIRPSSRGLNTPALMSSTLNIGQFRRRAREPSILGSNRRRQGGADVTTDQSASEREDDPEDDAADEFAPDAESTPLHRRKTQPAPAESPEPREDEPALPPARNTRKRKSGEVEQEASNRPKKTSRAEEPIEIEDDGDSDDSISDESLPSPVTNAPGPLPIPDNRPSTPVHQSEDGILAPPLSSGSAESVAWPSIRDLAKRKRRVDNVTPSRPLDDDLSDMSSPPSLTHSPNLTSKKIGGNNKTRGRAPKRQPSPKFTTADLEAMLAPRRRKVQGRGGAAGDAFDLSSDPVDTAGLGHDDDELEHLDTRRRRTRSAARPPTTTGRAANAEEEDDGGQPGSAAKGKRKQQQQKKKRKPRVSRTYSRRDGDEDEDGEEGTGDRSFAPLPDDTFDSGNGSLEILDPKNELRNAVKKFKDVDQWALEYEEVTTEESQPDAR